MRKEIPSRVDNATVHVAMNYNSAMKKLRAVMNAGPFGAPAVVTPSEATVLYRMITEQAGMRDMIEVPGSIARRSV